VSLKAPEVAALLRLCNELHDAAPDPTARKKRMVEGLCRLLGADAGLCVATHVDAKGRSATVVSVARWGMTEDDALALAEELARRASGAEDRRGRSPRPGRERSTAYHSADHCLESRVAVAGMTLQACLTLFRRPPARSAFSRREQAVLELFHSQMGWLYRPDLPLVSPAGLALSPRQRETLQFLLAGHSEKQIAAGLGLSPNTVHHYVKAIHRHFKVSSRSELLARWVRK
jgi:DNA-binding CsgD family transcriptional regulator